MPAVLRTLRDVIVILIVLGAVAVAAAAVSLADAKDHYPASNPMFETRCTAEQLLAATP